MSLITSALGCALSPLLCKHSYWAAKLNDGTWLCERDHRVDLRTASKRPFDWCLNVVATGDVSRVTELWLFCPPTPMNPLGNTARLPIVEPGTAFQFKVGSLDSAIVTQSRQVEGQIIGRVDNKETGECTVFIWDAQLRMLGAPWKTNVYHFGSWRDGVAPIGALSHEVLGLRLG